MKATTIITVALLLFGVFSEPYYFVREIGEKTDEYIVWEIEVDDPAKQVINDLKKRDIPADSKHICYFDKLSVEKQTDENKVILADVLTKLLEVKTNINNYESFGVLKGLHSKKGEQNNVAAPDKKDEPKNKPTEPPTEPHIHHTPISIGKLTDEKKILEKLKTDQNSCIVTLHPLGLVKKGVKASKKVNLVRGLTDEHPTLESDPVVAIRFNKMSQIDI